MEIKNATWFEAKVSYMKADAKGKEKKATEQYVVDALSFTEAEGRAIQYANAYSLKDAEVATLKKADYAELLFSDDANDDRWFKVKLAYVETDSDDSEKRTYTSYLVQAANIDRANQYIKDMMKDSTADYVIEVSQETKFMDVIEE